MKDKKSLFNAPKPIFDSENKWEPLDLDGMDPDRLEDTGVSISWSNLNTYGGTEISADLIVHEYLGDEDDLFENDVQITDVSTGEGVYGDWNKDLDYRPGPSRRRGHDWYQFDATPPAGTHGTFFLRFYDDTIDGQSGDVDSSQFQLDVRLATAAWSSVSFTSAKLQGTITFSIRNVDDIYTSSFEVLNSSGTAQTGWTITRSSNSANIGVGIIVKATPPTNTNASFKLRLKSESVHTNPGDIDSPACNVDSSSVAVDNRPATAAWSSVSFTGGKLQGTMTFSRANVSGISSSDFAVLNSSGTTQTGWVFDTPSTTATAGTGITIAATAPSCTNASFKLRLKSYSTISHGDSRITSPTSNVDSTAVSVDNRIFTIATAAWSSVSFSSGKLQGTLTFSGTSITGISTSDFEVLNSSGTTQTTWTFDTPSSTARSGSGITIAATPPSNLDANFKLRLKATSVRSGGSSSDNAPASAVESSAIAVNTIPAAVATATWGTPSYCTTSSLWSATLTFSGADITGLTIRDFEVLNSSNTVLTRAIHTWYGISSSVSSGSSVTIRFGPRDGYNTSMKMRLKANSVQSGGSTTNNAPASAVTSSAVSVNTVRTRATVTWQTVTGNTTLVGTLRFCGASVTGISSSDFEIPGRNSYCRTTQTWGYPPLSGWSITVSSSSVSSGGTITVTATPPANTRGLFRFNLKANTFHSDGARVANIPTSALRSNYGRVQNDGLPVNIGLGNRLGPGGNSMIGTLTVHDGGITGLAVSDLSVVTECNEATTGWTITITNLTSNSATITGTPPIDTNGRFKFKLDANSTMSNGATSDNSPTTDRFSVSLLVNNTATPTIARISWDNDSRYGTLYSAGSTLRLRLIIADAEITGIESSDFEVLDRNEIVQNGWTICSSATSSSSSVLITATPPLLTVGIFKVRLKQESLNSDGGTNNAPINNLDSHLVGINNTGYFSFSTRRTASGRSLAGRLIWRLVSISGMQSSDFEVLDFNNVVQTRWTISISSVTTIGFYTGVNITAIPPSNTNSIFRLRLKSKSLQISGTNFDNTPLFPVLGELISVNNTSSGTRAFLRWENVSGYSDSLYGFIGEYSGTALNGTLETNIDLTGLCPNDIEVLDSDGNRQSGWTANPQFSGRINRSYGKRISMVPPTNSYINGEFKLKLKANSLSQYRSGYSYSNNSPSSDLISNAVKIEAGLYFLKPYSYSNQISFNRSSNRLTIALGIESGAASGIESCDFEILDSNGMILSWSKSVSSSSVVAGTFFSTTSSTLTVTVPANTNQAVRVRLKENSLTVNGTSTTIPEKPMLSEYALVNNTSNTGVTVPRSSSTSSDLALPNSLPDPNGSTILRMSDSGLYSCNRARFNRLYFIPLTNSGFNDQISYNPPLNFSSFHPTVSGAVLTRSMDLQILDNANNIQDGWILYFYSSSGNYSISKRDIYVWIVPPIQTYGTFKVKLVGGSLSGNQPPQAIISTSALVDNRPFISVNSFTAPNSSVIVPTTSLNLNLSQNVPISEITATDFTVACNTTINSIRGINKIKVVLGTATRFISGISHTYLTGLTPSGIYSG